VLDVLLVPPKEKVANCEKGFRYVNEV